MDILTDPADIEDETKYSMPQRSLVADLVAINFLTRQSVQNMEGLAGADATGNSLLKVAKAGEVEVEFSNPKAADGNKLLMTADKLMAFYKSEASRKALLQGFILDFNEVGAMVIEVMSRPSPGLSNQNYSFGNDCD